MYFTTTCNTNVGHTANHTQDGISAHYFERKCHVNCLQSFWQLNLASGCTARHAARLRPVTSFRRGQGKLVHVVAAAPDVEDETATLTCHACARKSYPFVRRFLFSSCRAPTTSSRASRLPSSMAQDLLFTAFPAPRNRHCRCVLQRGVGRTIERTAAPNEMRPASTRR